MPSRWPPPLSGPERVSGGRRIHVPEDFEASVIRKANQIVELIDAGSVDANERLAIARQSMLVIEQRSATARMDDELRRMSK